MKHVVLEKSEAVSLLAACIQALVDQPEQAEASAPPVSLHVLEPGGHAPDAPMKLNDVTLFFSRDAVEL